MKIVAPEIYPRRRSNRYTPERDEFLLAHPGIDPAILADRLGLSERFVIGYQRKLGIRPLSGNRKK